MRGLGSKDDSIYHIKILSMVAFSWTTGRREADNRPRGLSYRESSDDVSTSVKVPVRSEPKEDDFFSFRSTQMTSITAENAVQKYLQDPEETLESLKAYPMVKALFLKYNSTLP